MRELVVVYGLPLLISGLTVAFGLAVAAILGAWTEHTDASRELAADVDASLTAVGKHGHLAVTVMGTSAPKLSRAIRQGEPLNLWRLAALPDAFWLAFIERIADRIGAVVIRPQQVAVFRGFAVPSSQTMVDSMRTAFNEERKMA